MADKTIQIDLSWRFERIYLRKADVTLHDAPEVFDMKWQPNADMNIHGNFRKVGENRFEVSLALTLTCKNLEKVAVEMKLEQAALVRVQSAENEDDVQRILAVEATNALFPYLREAVDNLAIRSSLPPLMLAHFNFEKVFEGLREMSDQQAQTPIGTQADSDEILN